MMKKTYLETLKDDIRTWMEDNAYYFNLEDYAGDVDAFEEYLNETLWIDDSVTGNASGSYTFNREEAKYNILANMGEVHEALTEFCYDPAEVGKMFLEEDFEKIDVITRCYFLSQAIREVIEEDNIEEELEKIEEELENA